MRNAYIRVLDSTLRDGAQSENVSFSVSDKLKIVSQLDEFGISLIEAGNPASNPTDEDFFRQVKGLHLKNAEICAFGMTVKSELLPSEDPNILSLAAADTATVVICGKAWLLHATEILRVTAQENLRIIADTITYFKQCGRRVLFDAEHFFDGCKDARDYAFEVLRTAAKSGADCLCLCDTNGGCLPDEISAVTAEVAAAFDSPLGVHCHDDTGCAVANTLAAVKNGVTVIQGTFNGIGERCGNANLSTLIPNLALKAGYRCDGKLDKLYSTATELAEVTNKAVHSNKPYVGRSAFAHKGGIHTDAVIKLPRSYEHISPELIGNSRRFLLSEVSGRSTVYQKLREFGIENITRDSPEVYEILKKIKEMESLGYQYEGADASYELLVKNVFGTFNPHFRLVLFKVIDEYPSDDGGFQSCASISIEVDGKTEITASLGNGPVNALDKALRKAISVFYPSIGNMYLSDYKVRVLDDRSATASLTRVLIESSGSGRVWTTVGVSSDIIHASVTALIDSVEYYLHLIKQP